MAINAAAVWRVRPSGNDANGSGYDGTTYPGGTDYTQQDAALATFTDLAAAQSSTTVTSASAQFTAAMVGNAIQINGGSNAIAGFYFVTARASATSVTLDRAPATAGALSAGTGRLGGGVASLQGVMGTAFGSGAGPVPLNTVYVRGAGSDTPSANDYAPSGYLSCHGGDGVTGRIKIRAENGRPRFGGNFSFYNLDYCDVQGMMFVAGGTVAGGTQGIVAGAHSILRNCVFDGAGYDVTLICTDFGVILENEFFHSAGSSVGTSPALYNTRRNVIAFNHFHNIQTSPVISISTSYPVSIQSNVFANNAGDVILMGGDAFEQFVVSGNTFTGNAGFGVTMTGTGSQLLATCITANVFANHTGAGKAAISIAGTQTSNDAAAQFVDGNAFYNNTANVVGLTSIGGLSQVLGADPFTAVGTENLVPTFTASFPIVGFPQRTAGKTTTMKPSQGQGAVAAAAASGITLSRAEIYSVA